MREQERKRSLFFSLSGSRRPLLALLVAAVAVAFGEHAAHAQASLDQNGTVERKNAITIEGGYRAAVFGLDAEVQTRVGPFLAVGPGLVRGGYALAAHAGYEMPLHGYWSLRPGVRVNRS